MRSKPQPTLTNLKKARTQLEHVIAMVEAEEYCIDIMTQNLAVIGLLRGAHEKLMEGHLSSCFRNAMTTASNTHKDTMIAEILQVTKLVNS
ncbi:metal-sensing transcriptional repressor [Candidatus Woesebacteria bacterium]|nr:metal-sensing transcriptional repressor [Candidatus Woesebacteria bacterium]